MNWCSVSSNCISPEQWSWPKSLRRTHSMLGLGWFDTSLQNPSWHFVRMNLLDWINGHKKNCWSHRDDLGFFLGDDSWHLSKKKDKNLHCQKRFKTKPFSPSHVWWSHLGWLPDVPPLYYSLSLMNLDGEFIQSSFPRFLNKTGVIVILYLIFGSFFWNMFFPIPNHHFNVSVDVDRFHWKKTLFESNNRTANSKHEFLQIPLIFPKWDHHCDGHTFSCSESWEVEVEGGFQSEKNDDILRTNSKLTNCDAKYVMNLHVCWATVLQCFGKATYFQKHHGNTNPFSWIENRSKAQTQSFPILHKMQLTRI